MPDAPPLLLLSDDMRLAVGSFFFGLDFQDCPGSIEECIRQMREIVPQTDLTDENLEIIIARLAIERGFTVDLDEGELIARADLSILAQARTRSEQ
ncbi:hypothetical protein [Mesorhizobium sp. A623]